MCPVRSSSHPPSIARTDRVNPGDCNVQSVVGKSSTSFARAVVVHSSSDRLELEVDTGGEIAVEEAVKQSVDLGDHAARIRSDSGSWDQSDSGSGPGSCDLPGSGSSSGSCDPSCSGSGSGYGDPPGSGSGLGSGDPSGADSGSGSRGPSYPSSGTSRIPSISSTTWLEIAHKPDYNTYGRDG